MSQPSASACCGLDRVDRFLEVALRWASVACLAVLVVLVTTLVFIRFVPLFTLDWADEIVELVFAWMVFLGAAAIWRSHEHITIDFLPLALAGTRMGRVLEVGIGVLAIGFLTAFTWYGWLFTAQSQGNTSPMLTLPRPLWYAAIPVSGLVMIGYTLVRILRCLRACRSADRPEGDR